MSQINQKQTRTLPLIGAICASMLIGLPAIAQSSLPDPNKPAANTDPKSSENSNPGLNTSPANRVNTTPGMGDMMSPGMTRDRQNTDMMSPSMNQRQNTDMMSPGMNQRRMMNRQRPMLPTTSPSSFDGSSGSAVLNPCPSIFYESKYAGMGIKPPAGCPSVSPSTSSSDRMMSPDSGSMPMTMPTNNQRRTRPGSQ